LSERCFELKKCLLITVADISNAAIESASQNLTIGNIIVGKAGQLLKTGDQYIKALIQLSCLSAVIKAFIAVFTAPSDGLGYEISAEI